MLFVSSVSCVCLSIAHLLSSGFFHSAPKIFLQFFNFLLFLRISTEKKHNSFKRVRWYCEERPPVVYGERAELQSKEDFRLTSSLKTVRLFLFGALHSSHRKNYALLLCAVLPFGISASLFQFLWRVTTIIMHRCDLLTKHDLWCHEISVEETRRGKKWNFEFSYPLRCCCRHFTNKQEVKQCQIDEPRITPRKKNHKSKKAWRRAMCVIDRSDSCDKRFNNFVWFVWEMFTIEYRSSCTIKAHKINTRVSRQRLWWAIRHSSQKLANLSLCWRETERDFTMRQFFNEHKQRRYGAGTAEIRQWILIKSIRQLTSMKIKLKMNCWLFAVNSNRRRQGCRWRSILLCASSSVRSDDDVNFGFYCWLSANE